MIASLLWPKWRMLWNVPRSAGVGPGKAALFVLLGVAVWVGIYAGSEWFLGRCLAVDLVGELLVEKILDLALLTMMSALLFSSVITAFSTFFLSDDLALLVTRPVPPDALYSARLLETAGVSAWMPLVFGAPLFVAAGRLFGAGWDYYALVAASLAPMGFLASAVGVLVTLFLAHALPAQRTRDVLTFLGVLAVVIVFLLVRSIRPEELLSPERFGSTMELFSSLQSPSAGWMPSEWARRALVAGLRGDATPWGALVGLWSSSGAFYFFGAWAFRGLHASGYSKAMEGRHEGSGLERAAGWFRRAKASGPEAGARALAELRQGQGELRLLPEMIRKDLRVFVRDTAQWSQLLLLGALLALYVMNFRYFRVLGQGGILGPLGLFWMNIALCGFVMAAVGARFLFPSVSLEGKSFWRLRSAPQTMESFLWAKWAAGALPLLVVSEALAAGTNLLVGTPWSLVAWGAALIAALNVGVAGLGVGLGAVYPRFHVDNAAKIASGFGGILYMFLALVMLAVSATLSAGPSWVLFHLALGGQTGVGSTMGLVWAGLAGVGSVGLPVVAGVAALKWGARRLSD